MTRAHGLCLGTSNYYCHWIVKVSTFSQQPTFSQYFVEKNIRFHQNWTILNNYDSTEHEQQQQQKNN